VFGAAIGVGAGAVVALAASESFAHVSSAVAAVAAAVLAVAAVCIGTLLFPTARII
jgi:hypothetical protein